MAERKPARAKAGATKTPAAKAAAATPAGAQADGYEGVDWHLYDRVRPNHRHSGATGAGLVEYTLWFEAIQNRPESHRHDVGLPGQPVR